jgi:hypothetical protein
MPTEFPTRFAREENLTEDERNFLDYMGVRSPEDVDSLLSGFPSISHAGVRVNVLSNAAALHMSNPAYTSIAASVAAHPPAVSLGAQAPPGVPTSPGSTVGMPPPMPFAAPSTPSTSIDLRLTPWAIRDQGQRGTCVAFGTTACVEHSQSRATGGPAHFSEQFLYWAIKTHTNDPRPTTDGTWLQFARDALQSHGICNAHYWSYVGGVVSPVSGDTQADPSSAALADAAAHKFQFPPGSHIRRPSDATAMVIQHLQSGRPVAISLPVYRDPVSPPNENNWTTPVGWAYGRVFNPPTQASVIGGHCVCITGFVPDPNEPNGGHFVIRNSWGTQWGAQAPLSPYNSPEPGFGEISASYVESFCWELLTL